MHVDVYGCAISLFPVAALRYLLESCLHMPLYVGLGVSLGLVDFGELGAPLCGGDCVWRCQAGVGYVPPLPCFGGERGLWV